MSDTTPNLGLSEMPQNTLQPSVPFNESMQLIDMLMVLVIQDLINDPPVTVAADVGKRWVVGPVPTGAWVGHTNDIAFCTGAGLWSYFTPKDQWRGWFIDNAGAPVNTYYRFVTSTGWVDDTAAGAIAEAPSDTHFYSRKDGAWVQNDPPDLTPYVKSVNGSNPDAAGNVAIPSPYALAGINDQIGTAYTLAETDAGKDVRCSNAAAITVTVPAEATMTTPFDVGTLIVVSQGGAGLVTLASDGTTVLRNPNGDSTAMQYDARVLEYLGTDEWRIW